MVSESLDSAKFTAGLLDPFKTSFREGSASRGAQIPGLTMNPHQPKKKANLGGSTMPACLTHMRSFSPQLIRREQKKQIHGQPQSHLRGGFVFASCGALQTWISETLTTVKETTSGFEVRTPWPQLSSSSDPEPVALRCSALRHSSWDQLSGCDDIAVAWAGTRALTARKVFWRWTTIVRCACQSGSLVLGLRLHNAAHAHHGLIRFCFPFPRATTSVNAAKSMSSLSSMSLVEA